VLDLVEKPLDLIPGSIEIRAEADRIVAIAFRRDVGPRAPFIMASSLIQSAS
jgi:hypothetical protein